MELPTIKCKELYEKPADVNGVYYYSKVYEDRIWTIEMMEDLFGVNSETSLVSQLCVKVRELVEIINEQESVIHQQKTRLVNECRGTYVCSPNALPPPPRSLGEGQEKKCGFGSRPTTPQPEIKPPAQRPAVPYFRLKREN